MNLHLHTFASIKYHQFSGLISAILLPPKDKCPRIDLNTNPLENKRGLCHMSKLSKSVVDHCSMNISAL